MPPVSDNAVDPRVDLEIRDHPVPRGSGREVLPGFGVSLGYTVFYLSLIVLVPLSALFLKASGQSWAEFAHTVFADRALAAYRVSFGASLIAAVINSFFGLILAWVLVRYPMPGRRVLDALVDLPFALPTAVAGIALAALYAHNGWIGSWLEPLWRDAVASHSWLAWAGDRIAFDRPGVVLALTFVGLPFVVRTLQPVLEELEPELEEAAATLGASRWQTVTRVLLPELAPALLTGFALSFARALGEYGSVVFISGNLPYRTEIVPLLIVTKLEQFDYRGASALAVVMLVGSFALLLAINLLQKWSRRHHRV